jgi:hypothetical protein
MFTGLYKVTVRPIVHLQLNYCQENVKSCHIQWKKAVSENTAASQAIDEHPNGK